MTEDFYDVVEDILCYEEPFLVQIRQLCSLKLNWVIVEIRNIVRR